MQALLALIAYLPEILRLIKAIQENQKKSEIERLLKDDIKIINKAFEEQDAKALNDLFNNTSDK
jgi:hypothetical protein